MRHPQAWGSHPPGSNEARKADLTLYVGAAAGTRISLDVEVNHLGDFSSPNAFRIDLGDDGSDELVSAGSQSSTYRGHHLWSHDAATGVLPVRIRTDQFSGFAPQAYSLQVDIRTWPVIATATGPDCGLVVYPQGLGSRETTNYHLTVLDPVVAEPHPHRHIVSANTRHEKRQPGGPGCLTRGHPRCGKGTALPHSELETPWAPDRLPGLNRCVRRRARRL